MDKRIDLLMALVVLVLGVWYFGEAGKIRVPSLVDPLGVGTYPKFLALGLILCGAVLTITRLIQWFRVKGVNAPPEGEEDTPGYHIVLPRVLGIGITAVAYVVALPNLGYIISTPIFMAVALTILGSRGWKPLLGMSLGFAAVLYLVFGVFLGVQLPVGPLISVLRG